MIRKATPDDLKPLAALYKEFMIYHNKLAPKQFKIPDDAVCEDKFRFYIKQTHDKSGVFSTLCHETNGVIDGYAVYYPSSTEGTAEKPDGTLEVNQLFVAENARHKGIGTEIVREIRNIAKERHFAAFTIDVHVNNTGAKQFYEKAGLVPIQIKMEKRI